MSETITTSCVKIPMLWLTQPVEWVRPQVSGDLDFLRREFGTSAVCQTDSVHS